MLYAIDHGYMYIYIYVYMCVCIHIYSLVLLIIDILTAPEAERAADASITSKLGL